MTPEDPASSCFAKPGHGDFGEPVVLFQHGDVPEME
jgi:hypothetical protein